MKRGFDRARGASADSGRRPARFLQHLETELRLPLARPAVFAFFADARNLEAITPPELRFEIRTPQPQRLERGALIEYRLTLAGVRFGWTTRIAEWDPPRSFVDEQLAGPYRSWVHQHEFEESADGTLIRDRVAYELPWAPWSAIALPLVRRQLARIFHFRSRRVSDLLVGEGSREFPPCRRT